MSIKLIKGYVLAILSVLILAAAAILVLTNMDPWTLHVYYRDVTLPRAAWLLLAAGGGLVLFWTIRKLLPAAITTLREGRKVKQVKNDHQRLEDLTEQKSDSP